MGAILKDVAKLAGVSVATASQALNNKSVNEETRRRVLAAAQKLRYVQNSAGRNLITGRSHTVGLYILNTRTNPDLSSDSTYFYPLLRGVLYAGEKAGYSLNFAVKLWEELGDGRWITQKALSHAVDGMIIIPQYTYHYGFVQELEQLGFPYVLISPMDCPDRGKCVSLDDYRGACLATQCLIDAGFTQIGLINGPPNHYDAIVRQRAFVETAAKAGVRVNPDWVVPGEFTTESGYRAMRQILEEARAPQALFCANDFMAAGAMLALDERGLRVPEDVSIVGYDDSEVARSVHPQLTTVRNPTYQIGEAAMERLLAYIGGQSGLAEIVFEPELVVRGSCRLAASLAQPERVAGS